jgi:hypothetical protein
MLFPPSQDRPDFPEGVTTFPHGRTALLLAEPVPCEKILYGLKRQVGHHLGANTMNKQGREVLAKQKSLVRSIRLNPF